MVPATKPLYVLIKNWAASKEKLVGLWDEKLPSYPGYITKIGIKAVNTGRLPASMSPNTAEKSQDDEMDTDEVDLEDSEDDEMDTDEVDEVDLEDSKDDEMDKLA
jgi:hypothetical protein